MIAKIIFYLFRKQFIKLAFNTQSKPKGFEDMEWCFIDSNGKNYYKHIKDDEIPIIRKLYLCLFDGELSAKVNGRELLLIGDAFRKAAYGAVEAKTNLERHPHLQNIILLVEEIEKRHSMILHLDLMFDIISVLYVREDEDPALFDKDIHNQKVNQFKQDSAGGLYDFFYQGGFAQFMPSFKDMRKDFPAYLNESEAILKGTENLLSFISGEDSQSNKTSSMKQ